MLARWLEGVPMRIGNWSAAWLCVFCLLAGASFGQNVFNLQDDESERLELQASLESAEKLVQRLPDSPSARVERGMALFSLGKVEQSLVDFDQAIALNEALKPNMWQRGIALYYLGRFQDAAEQFEVHHQVNPDDVENTAWYYLCLAKADGVEKAAGAIIPSRGDARPAMMDILKLYSGKLTPEELIASIDSSDKTAMFYASLYVGLYHEAHGRSDVAKSMIAKSVEQGRGGYMLRVAKVDLASRTASVSSK